MDVDITLILLPVFCTWRTMPYFRFLVAVLRESLARGTKRTKSLSREEVLVLLPLSPGPFTFLHTFFLSKRNGNFFKSFFPLQFSRLFECYCFFHTAYLFESDTERFFLEFRTGCHAHLCDISILPLRASTVWNISSLPNMDMTYGLSYTRFPVNSQLSTEMKDSHISHFTRKCGRNSKQVKCIRSDKHLRVNHSSSSQYIHNSHRYQEAARTPGVYDFLSRQL